MMGLLSIIDESIEYSLSHLHTAYLARVISTDGKTASVQALGLYKNSSASIANVPVVKSARYKMVCEDDEGVEIIEPTPNPENPGGSEQPELGGVVVPEGAKKLAYLEPIEVGDIVICVCCDRDITQARKGKNSIPVYGHHSLSDSIVVGIL